MTYILLMSACLVLLKKESGVHFILRNMLKNDYNENFIVHINIHFTRNKFDL